MLQDNVGAISRHGVWGLQGTFGRSVQGRSTFLLHSVKSCVDGMEKKTGLWCPSHHLVQMKRRHEQFLMLRRCA